MRAGRDRMRSTLLSWLPEDLTGLRLLDGRFMVINQAMGLPRGRDAAARYVDSFVEEMFISREPGANAEQQARHEIWGSRSWRRLEIEDGNVADLRQI